MNVHVLCSDASVQQHEGPREEDETPNYEEKAQEIVQSILQEVVNTVAGGETCSFCCLPMSSKFSVIADSAQQVRKSISCAYNFFSHWLRSPVFNVYGELCYTRCTSDDRKNCAFKLESPFNK